MTAGQVAIPPRRRFDPDVVRHQRRVVAQAARIHAEEIWRAERRRRPCRCEICQADRGDAHAFALVVADALRRRAARLVRPT